MTFERRLKPNVNVDLTPLIDVVFQLVIFFMISSTFKTAPGIDLDLPSSSSSAAIAVTELSITVVSPEEVYVNKARTTAAGAEALIQAELQGKDPAEIDAALSARASAPYQTVVTLLDALRKNGVTRVGLATEPATGTPRQGP